MAALHRAPLGTIKNDQTKVKHALSGSVLPQNLFGWTSGDDLLTPPVPGGGVTETIELTVPASCVQMQMSLQTEAVLRDQLGLIGNCYRFIDTATLIPVLLVDTDTY